MTLRNGNRFGAYIIRYHIAQGGTGDVYCAEDTRDQQLVALKIPTTAARYDPRQYEFFLRELAALPLLDHPAIQHCREYDQVGAFPYLATTLIDGHALRRVLKEAGVLPITEAVAIVRAVAEGMAYCHAHGVIHRDLKPENILIGTNGQPVIIDFGLAIVVNRPTFGTPGGTPDYMSPEQVAGDPADRRVDIYALGVVLYELLTGRVPFTGADALTVMRARLHQPVPRADVLRPDVPLALTTVIARCLQIRPDRRYADMTALMAGLDQLDQVDTTALESLIVPPPKARFWQTPPGQALLTTAAFFVGIALVTLLLVALKH